MNSQVSHVSKNLQHFLSPARIFKRKGETYQNEIGRDPPQDFRLGAIGEEELVLVHVDHNIY